MNNRKEGMRMSMWKRKMEMWINGWFSALKEDSGMGVVEVILIIVVLIGLVIIFQTNIKNVVSSIMGTIQTNAGKIR